MITIQEAYIKVQDACGFKEGDKVKVVRKAVDHELGWGMNWYAPYMDSCVGESGTVSDISNDGVAVDFDNGDTFYFPFFVLESAEYEITYVELCKDLKPFDKVLCRDDSSNLWELDLFGRYDTDEEWFDCVSGRWYQCMPYKSNEHYYNTTDNPI